MYCQGIEIENAFFKALSETDRFSIKKDTLFLGNEIRPKLLKLVAMK
jgi:heat shock protein HslJ